MLWLFVVQAVISAVHIIDWLHRPEQSALIGILLHDFHHLILS